MTPNGPSKRPMAKNSLIILNNKEKKEKEIQECLKWTNKTATRERSQRKNESVCFIKICLRLKKKKKKNTLIPHS